jgi:CheY-specific phosphatase CheX
MKNPPEIGIDPVCEWFTQAVLDVSETMFGLEAYPAGPADGVTSTDATLVACIGVRGDCRLEVAMYFPRSLAARLAGISLDLSEEDLDEKMVEDVAGEFSNMAAGAVKSRLSDLEVPCTMTVPRVVRCTPDAASSQKVQAALAVIRGSAGPRDASSAPPVRLFFEMGGGRMYADLYL